MKKILILFLVGVISLFAKESFVNYKVNEQDYQGYFSSPSNNAPLVFMIHDWDGLSDYEIKRAKMLYDLGYATFIVDLFGKDIKPQTIEDKKRLTGNLYKDRDKMRKILYAGLNAAKKQGANIDNAIGTGYCFGGAAILEFARSGANLKSFIPFHGGLKTPEKQDYSQIKGDIIVFHGSADKAVSMQEFANLATELEEAKIPHEMITYSGAPHAFTVFGSKRYHEKADKKSWARFTQILEEKLK